MKIGVDITALYINRAGILTYSYNLLKHLLAIDRETQYLLLDYVPVRRNLVCPLGLEVLRGPNVRVVGGHLPWFCLPQKERGAAYQWNRLALWPWARWREAQRTAYLQAVLNGVDVFHSSDVMQCTVAGARNVVTVWDLTPVLFPKWHTPSIARLQQAKLGFAKDEADHIIAISYSTKRDLTTHLSIPADKI
ncbi:MAG TPA: hypothetical protein EYP49_13520, partial [Anaerolineae bacterium]|nr:hypothetical protein [Anaerolineae bacterium]